MGLLSRKEMASSIEIALTMGIAIGTGSFWNTPMDQKPIIGILNPDRSLPKDWEIPLLLESFLAMPVVRAVVISRIYILRPMMRAEIELILILVPAIV